MSTDFFFLQVWTKHQTTLVLAYLLYCIRAMIGSESRGLPTPNLLTAEILNWYSLPLIRLVALKEQASHLDVTIAQEILEVSLFSTT